MNTRQLSPVTAAKNASFTPNRGGLLQRKCACGGTPGATGECEECGQKQLLRKARNADFGTPDDSSVPRIVDEALRSPGQPLDVSTRAFMEPKFGHDFSHVRVHADREAGNAAQAVQARAYTCGSNIVFGAGEYAPSTANGKRLLAHELTHVVQQSNGPSFGGAQRIGAANDPAEAEADRVAETVVASNATVAPSPISQQAAGVISRQPSPVNCGVGQNGAPANAENILEMLKIFALLATTLADAELTSLQLDAVLPGLGAGGGFTMPTGPRIQNYTNRFGLPPAAGRGRFRNRLSGATFPSQAQALVEEAKSLQARYSRIADFLGGTTIRFRCITNPTNVGGCVADCSIASAFGCPTVIMVCPNFWTFTRQTQSQLLIHEVAHAIFGILHGRNFTHADCFAAYAADAQATASTTSPVCVP